MSGHSKWSTIKRKKEKTDGARAKVFTKIGRELAVAVREGGGADPSSNSKLRECIAKAKANNVPNENIERIIKKAAGSADGSNYESITYEGYGPCGIAVIVETLTDNRNRTAGDVRHFFDKYRGNLGTQGCVSFMFTQKGLLVIEKEDNDEDKLMEDALEAGAEDFSSESSDVYEIYTAPEDFSAVMEVFKRISSLVASELNDEPLTEELLSCAKLHLWRRILYGTRIPVKDIQIINSIKK